MRAVAVFACALVFGSPLAAKAGVCRAWSPPATIGTLSADPIDEASGLEASRAFPGRLYHNNDSGDELRFYITGMSGGGVRTVDLKGPKPKDIEDMSLGPCGKGTCLYLGDIGDNPANRSEVVFTLVKEKAKFDDKEKPHRVIRARYPDGAHNAEAFAVHPNGDLFLVTKPSDAKAAAPGPALVYRLTANQLRAEDGVQVFAKVGEIDLPRLLTDLPFYGWIATGLDISADGKRAVLLTYMAVIELGFDLTVGVPAKLTLGQTYSVFRAPPLAQQEAIAWLPDDSGFLYDSEVARGAKSAPLNRVVCASR